MKKSVKFSPKFVSAPCGMVAECRGDHTSQWAAVESIAAKIRLHRRQTLLTWARQHERDTGQRDGPTTADQKRSRNWSARSVTAQSQ